MLHFELHDGVQAIEGIEYSPIKKLELDKIEPGCKVIFVFCFFFKIYRYDKWQNIYFLLFKDNCKLFLQ